LEIADRQGGVAGSGRAAFNPKPAIQKPQATGTIMPVITRCIHCQKPAQVAESQVEKLVRCPACQQVFLARRDSGEPPTTLRSLAGATPSGAPASRATASAGAGPRNEPAAPTRCPACGGKLPAGRKGCGECGWTPTQVENGEEQPLLCTNPACGVANPTQERYCQRCHTLLPSAPGTVLHGRYRIDRLLAIGGFGAVYLGQDVKTGQAVAIKDMIAADGEEFQIRLNFFKREAEILQLLKDSPIVPRFHDFVQDGATAHLVMEYIPGQDLLKVLETRKFEPFPPDLVSEWGRQVCDVLSLLHAQNPPIVHRDLKPDNIMLLEDGRSIKLIDFGTARDMGRGARSRLAAKTRVFTEGYAPPEQIIGKPETRSDLFALAGTLYQLLTGKAPEGHYTALELKEQLAGNGAIPPERRWLFDLLRINLAEDANDRYYSAREFKHDLGKRAVTSEVSCPQCGQVNKVREPYCAACAAPLTDPAPACAACGKQNRLGSRFCTACGTRLR
jgi:hypothetical protein